MPEHFSKNFLEKTVILNHTSQYRVGVFKNHCFFRKILGQIDRRQPQIFLEKSAKLCI